MEYSGAGGKLNHEKNQKQKISWHCPFNAAKYGGFIYILRWGGGGGVEATSTTTKMLVLLSVNQICNLGTTLYSAQKTRVGKL